MAAACPTITVANKSVMWYLGSVMAEQAHPRSGTGHKRCFCLGPSGVWRAKHQWHSSTGCLERQRLKYIKTLAISLCHPPISLAVCCFLIN